MSIFSIDTSEDRRPGWWKYAACNNGTGYFAKLFFSEDLGDIQRAVDICAGCPYTGEGEICFEGAVARREKHGVWGGVVFDEAVLRRARRKARKAEEAEADAA